MYKRTSKKSLNAAAATGNGTTVDFGGSKSPHRVRWFIHAAGVTSGATVKTDVSYDGTNWVEAASTTVSATGNTTGTIDGPVRFCRHRISARTDGTYTSYFEAGV